jgi:general L-amino acid transport system substrate-binding protein
MTPVAGFLRRLGSVTPPLPSMAMLLGFLTAMPLAAAADRVDDIKSRGHLICGLAPDRPGFAVVSGQDATGLGADFCRGIAAAIFGRPGSVRFAPVDTIKGFLESDVDVVFHELTWTFNRELTSGLAFGPVYFFDGQSFLARSAAGLTSAAQLPDATVCAEASTGFVDNLIAFIQDRAPGMRIAVLGTREAAQNGFFAGHCDLLTGDVSDIYAVARSRGGGDYTILAERLSKEPVAPVVRRADERLLAIVRWSIFAAIEAEELGVTAANVDTYANWGLFGSLVDRPASSALGLAPDWARSIVRAIGNYGEVYDRNLGSGNVRMSRGLNELWSRGGLLYSPPLR